MLGYLGSLWFAGDSYVYVGAALRPQPNLSKSTGYSLIMAETVFTFCLFLAMFLLLWRDTITWWSALIAGLLVGYAVIVRTEGLPVLVLFPAFLLLRCWRTTGWRKLSGWLTTTVMVLGCLVPRRRLCDLVSFVLRILGLDRVNGLLPVGKSLILRRLLPDQRASQRDEGLPDRGTRHADAAR